MNNNLSSETLFHYTREYKTLFDIISNGFKFGYSLENFEPLIESKNIVFQNIAIPMICLCDIPISLIKNHTLTYGNYAIGVKKNWAINNKFTPVLYTHQNSALTDLLNEIYLELEKFIKIHVSVNFEPNLVNNLKDVDFQKKINTLLLKNNKKANQTYQEHVDALLDKVNGKVGELIKYIKPYKGNLNRDIDKVTGMKEVKFYDEKEWRFIPPKNKLTEMQLKDTYSEKDFLDPIKKRAINLKTFKNYYPIKFSEINFIIVANDNEIKKMIIDLNQMKLKDASTMDIELLKTKIISLDTIKNDF